MLPEQSNLNHTASTEQQQEQSTCHTPGTSEQAEPQSPFHSVPYPLPTASAGFEVFYLKTTIFVPGQLGRA